MAPTPLRRFRPIQANVRPTSYRFGNGLNPGSLPAPTGWT